MSVATTWRRRWWRLVKAARGGRAIQLGLAVALVVLIVAQPAASHVRSTTGYSVVRSDLDFRTYEVICGCCGAG